MMGEGARQRGAWVGVRLRAQAGDLDRQAPEGEQAAARGGGRQRRARQAGEGQELPRILSM